MPSTVASSADNRSLLNQLKKWRKIPGITRPYQEPLNNRGQSTPIVPETQPLETESTETQPTGEGGAGPTLDAPEPPRADPLLLDYPLRSLQFMPPPPNPPRVDEDEIMDIVPDSEPSRMADGPMSSLHLPRPASRMTVLAENDSETVPETVPESSAETDNETSEQGDKDHIARNTNIQETEPDTEQEVDPMDTDLPPVKRRTKRPPKPLPEEEEVEEEQVEQAIRDDATVPETEDEVPLATVVKTAKAAPKPPLPPRGRSARNKRPIIYTESPDTSENEVSMVKF